MLITSKIQWCRSACIVFVTVSTCIVNIGAYETTLPTLALELRNRLTLSLIVDLYSQYKLFAYFTVVRIAAIG